MMMTTNTTQNDPSPPTTTVSYPHNYEDPSTSMHSGLTSMNDPLSSFFTHNHQDQEETATSGASFIGDRDNTFYYLPDDYIVWAITLSILVIQIYDNWEDIFYQHQFTFGTTLGLMLLSFIVGMEIDEESFLYEIKTNFFGITKGEKSKWDDNNMPYFQDLSSSYEGQPQIYISTRRWKDYRQETTKILEKNIW